MTRLDRDSWSHDSRATEPEIVCSVFRRPRIDHRRQTRIPRFVCLSLSVCLRLPLCISVYLSVCLSLCVSVRMSRALPIVASGKSGFHKRGKQTTMEHDRAFAEWVGIGASPVRGANPSQSSQDINHTISGLICMYACMYNSYMYVRMYGLCMR